MIPPPIKQFIEAFSKLPSLGPRAATRLAFYITKLGKNEIAELERALGGLKNLSRCGRCFFLKDETKEFCEICANPKRNARVIAIVEKETDLLTIERSGEFNGHYLVLGELAERGTLEPAQKLRLQNLKTRILQEESGAITELILALNLTAAGDITANIIRDEFQGLVKHITRIGRGIPTGGEIEFADEETLIHALKRRGEN